MPAIKLNAFGGMIPAQDDRLLSDANAAYSKNAWLYSGALEGIREPKLVHTCTAPGISRVFRIPKDHVSKDYIVDSYWLEFTRQDVDVVKAPMDNDAYGRFYWAGDADDSGVFPRYNTRDRIAAGQSYYKLGVPGPSVAPVVTTSPSAPLAAANGAYRFGGNPADLRYVKRNVANGTRIITAANGALSTNGANAVLAYQNNANVTQYDALTAARIIDPDFPSDPGLSDPKILTSRAYVYTWVTSFSEEGPPSPATVLNGLQTDNWNVQLTAPTADDLALRELATVRIYRTITSSLGQATYFFVAELPIATTSYADTNTDETVSSNNQLDSTFWTAPPENLAGMIAMPNGMIAGFAGNEIWFCEPFRPHAWPVIYTLSVEYNIVGLGVMGQTLIVCTESSTFACTGINPSAMSIAVIGTGQPCLSRSGIVSTLSGVFYPSPNGIVAASPSGVQVITEKLVTRDKWNALLRVPKLHSALLGGAYYTFGTQAQGCFQSEAFEPTTFELQDFTGSYTGALINPSDPRTAYMTLTTDVSTLSVFNDPWSGEVLIVRGGGVYHIDVTAGTRSSYVWKSKVMQAPYQRNFEAMKIYFDVPDEAVGNMGTVRLYANGNLVWQRPLVTSGVLMRLPSGFKADFWQVEVETRVILWSVQMATSARELASV